MKKEINLTLGRKKESTLSKRVLLGASVLFSVVVIISIGILSYRLVLSTKLSSLSNNEETLIIQLNSLREQRDKMLTIKERLEESQRIIGKRLNITSKFDELATIIPQKATLETFTGTDEEIELQVESDSLDSLGELINEKISTLTTDKKRGIKKIEMKNFMLNPTTKVYSVIFGITYN